MGRTGKEQHRLIEYIEDQQIHYLYYIQQITTTGKKRQFVLNYLEDYEKIMIANGWLEVVGKMPEYDVERVAIGVTKCGKLLLEELGLRRIALACLRVGDSTFISMLLSELQLSDFPEVLISKNTLIRYNANELYHTLYTRYGTNRPV